MSMGGNAALKFVVEVQNKQAIDELTDDIKKQEKEIKTLTTALKAGALSEDQFKNQAMAAGQAIATATKEMKALQGASAMSGRGLMQLGYAVDDIQYGFSAIVNNIPQIAMGFGAGAGLAGGIAIASVAISQLIKHWGELSDIAQSAWSGGSVDQLKKIREAAEEATEAFKKLTEEHTEAQEASQKFVHKAIVEGGVGKILEGLTAGIANDPAMAAPLEKGLERMVDKDYAKKLMDAAAKANRDKASQLILDIEKPGAEGEAARATARRLVRANPRAFPKGFEAKLDPEAAEAEENRLQNLKDQAKGNKNIREAEKAAEAEKLRMNKELTSEGERNEEMMKRRQFEDQKRDIQEQIKRGEHLLTPEGRQQLQDQMLGGKAPEQSTIMSVKAFADKMLTAGMNSVPQKQLDTLVGMHNTLKDIDKKMRAQGLE